VAAAFSELLRLSNEAETAVTADVRAGGIWASLTLPQALVSTINARRAKNCLVFMMLSDVRHHILT
jgi:hypothetical protein